MKAWEKFLNKELGEEGSQTSSMTKRKLKGKEAKLDAILYDGRTRTLSSKDRTFIASYLKIK